MVIKSEALGVDRGMNVNLWENEWLITFLLIHHLTVI